MRLNFIVLVFLSLSLAVAAATYGPGSGMVLNRGDQVRLSGTTTGSGVQLISTGSGGGGTIVSIFGIYDTSGTALSYPENLWPGQSYANYGFNLTVHSIDSSVNPATVNVTFLSTGAAATATPTPTPTPTPSPSPTPTATPTPSPSPTATSTPSPSPTISLPVLPTNITVRLPFRFTLSIAQGWSLISTPIVSPTVLSNGCGRVYLWSYDPQTKQYTRVSDFGALVPGVGYWALSKGACQVELGGFTRASLTGVSLAKGWNLIGASYASTPWANVQGTCRTRSGPWAYNSPTRSYARSTLLEPGKGYWVYVNSACTLR